MQNPCPEKSLLQEWLTGTLSISQAETLVEHVEQCEACQSSLDVLEAEMQPPLQLFKFKLIGGVCLF